jgi:hypothetical protein
MDTINAWQCVDAESGVDLAAAVREYFIPDFSGWTDRADFSARVGALVESLRRKDLAAAEEVGEHNVGEDRRSA